VRCVEVAQVISPQQVAGFSSVLWGVGFVVGLLALLLPHGASVQDPGWAAVDAFAGVAAVWTFRHRDFARTRPNFATSLLALAAVDLAMLFAHHGPVLLAAGGLFVLPTIFAASFYSSRAFLLYLVAQTISSAVVMFASGVPGASAGWALVVGPMTVVGVVVHLLGQALKQAAVTDPLTGLANRRAFEAVTAHELARCARLGHPLSLVVIDLDHFKDVNDSHGHQYGDRLLAEVTRAWMTQLRESDVLARAGGDEFVLLLPSTDVSQALSVLGRMARATPQGFSAGVVTGSEGGTVEEVLREADDACYRAKQAGGGRVVVSERTAA